MSGSLNTLNILNRYFYSYLLHNGNQDLKSMLFMIIMQCIYPVQYCFMTIGVRIGNKIGTRFITLIGFIFINLSSLLMMMFTNFYLILIPMCIFEFGCGLSNLSLIKNCWEYYPNRLGLINGIMIGGIGLNSCILTHIADNIINQQLMLPKDGIYPKDISDKFINYIIFLSILFFILSIISVCLTFNYQEEEDKSKIEELEEKPSLIFNKNSSNLCEGLFSEKNYFLLLFCFCGPCN